MKENQTTKYYWGIGLENETYIQFKDPQKALLKLESEKNIVKTK